MLYVKFNNTLIINTISNIAKLIEKSIGINIFPISGIYEKWINSDIINNTITIIFVIIFIITSFLLFRYDIIRFIKL